MPTGSHSKLIAWDIFYKDGSYLYSFALLE